MADRAYLQTYHRTGGLIHAHLLAHQQRADYGARLISRLAEALGANSRLIYRCLQFYRAYPNLSGRTKLAWAHYRVLMEIPDKTTRATLERESLRQGWTSGMLEARVRSINVTPIEEPTKPASPHKLLTPRRGTPGVCKVIAVAGSPAMSEAGPVVDLGFACYRDLAPGENFQAGDFVRVTETGVTQAQDATKADLFTYTAVVLRVVDGDTLWVKVYLEPARWVKQKLRLRDLDCPELATPEGKAAKRFVDTLTATTTAVTICTTKPDKYDRYLADVFLTTADGEVYLNNELLRHGHAVRKGDYSPADWEV